MNLVNITKTTALITAFAFIQITGAAQAQTQDSASIPLIVSDTSADQEPLAPIKGYVEPEVDNDPKISVVTDGSAASLPRPQTATRRAAGPSLTITTEGTRDNRAFMGQSWTAVVTSAQYVQGTNVTVRFTLDGRKSFEQVAQLQPVPGSTRGIARFSFTNKSAFRIMIGASIAPGQAATTVNAKDKRIWQMKPYVKPGERSWAAEELRHLLHVKHYVTGAKNVLDARTQRAVMAYRKLTGLPRNYEASAEVIQGLLAGKGQFKVRFPKHGRHIEGDIKHQVIALISKNGEVERIYPTSTGAPSTPTIRGSFRVYRKSPGTNEKGMVHSAYFIRGYAIHGFDPVPAYNASHGCLRVPVPDALSIFRWIKIGTIVDTYY